jgi:hypothetical protein
MGQVGNETMRDHGRCSSLARTGSCGPHKSAVLAPMSHPAD